MYNLEVVCHFLDVLTYCNLCSEHFSLRQILQEVKDLRLYCLVEQYGVGGIAAIIPIHSTRQG